MSDWRGLKMEEFELKLTEAEMQTVFNALVERPFKDVAGLVAKVQATYQKGVTGEVEQ